MDFNACEAVGERFLPLWGKVLLRFCLFSFEPSGVSFTASRSMTLSSRSAERSFNSHQIAEEQSPFVFLLPLLLQADLDGGSVTNTATATSNNTTSPPATATVTAEKKPAIAVAKSAAVKTITYTFTITNSGNLTLTGVNLTDVLVGYANVSCGGVTSLAPGATTTCTADYTLTAADLAANQVTNTATANAASSAGPVSNQVTVKMEPVKKP